MLKECSTIIVWGHCVCVVLLETVEQLVISYFAYSIKSTCVMWRTVSFPFIIVIIYINDHATTVVIYGQFSTPISPFRPEWHLPPTPSCIYEKYKNLLWVRRAKFGYIMYWENPLDCFYSWIYRSGKASVKGGSSPPAGKKAPLIRRAEDQRSSSTKRREPSPPTRKAPPASKSGQPPVRKRSLTPVGRNSSGHRRRSQTPPHSSGGKNKPTSSSRSSLSVKQPGTVVCSCSM